MEKVDYARLFLQFELFGVSAGIPNGKDFYFFRITAVIYFIMKNNLYPHHRKVRFPAVSGALMIISNFSTNNLSSFKLYPFDLFLFIQYLNILAHSCTALGDHSIFRGIYQKFYAPLHSISPILFLFG